MTKTGIILLAVFTTACAPSPSVTATIIEPPTASATIAISEATEEALSEDNTTEQLATTESVPTVLEGLDIDYGRYAGNEIEAAIALEVQWGETSRLIIAQCLTLPNNNRLVEISAHIVLV